jgi:hypothetical protein
MKSAPWNQALWQIWVAEMCLLISPVCLIKSDLENSWTGFHEVWYSEVLLQLVSTFQFWLESDNNNRHFHNYMHAFLCTEVTGWGIPALGITRHQLTHLALFPVKSSTMKSALSTKHHPRRGHWHLTTLTSLAPFSVVKSLHCDNDCYSVHTYANLFFLEVLLPASVLRV